MSCYLCGEPRNSYFGYFCTGCCKYKALCSLYKPSVVHHLLEKTLLITEGRIEHKLEKQLNNKAL